MKRRKKENSLPNCRQDGVRLGIVIDSGGGSAILPAGMLATLEELGYTDVFDAIYSTSGGALNSMYLLSREARKGIVSWWRDVPKTKTEDTGGYGPFVSLRRYFLGLVGLNNTNDGTFVCLDRIIYDIMDREDENQLNWDAVLERQKEVPIGVIVTNSTTGASKLLKDFKSKEELQAALFCSCFIPNISGPMRSVRGVEYADGILSSPLPWEIALNDGCTHVLCLVGKSKGKSFKRIPLIGKFLATVFFREALKYPKLWKNFMKCYSVKRNQFLKAMEHPNVEVVELLLGTIVLGSFTQNSIDAQKGAQDGYRAMAHALGESLDLPEELTKKISK